MPKVDPRDFLLDTDYEMDKIIYFKEGSIEVPHGEYKTFNFTHKLGFIPLVFGVCSFNSDFTNIRTLPFLDTENRDGTVVFDFDADNEKVKISYQDVNGRFPTTIYYRIYGLEPSNSHAKVGSTTKYAKQFILNTDYNYCKLYKKGTLSGNETTTITHNFGYMPQVLAWTEHSRFMTGERAIYPIETNAWSDPITNIPFGIEVTDKKVTFKFASMGSGNTIHYRIYYDEA